MPWARVGDEWWCHPKVMGLGLAPRGLWVSALSWSCAQRKDVVPAGFLPMVGATPEDTLPLVDAGLWVVVDGGWQIHDWSEYQEATVSEKRAEAGRKGGTASGKARKAKADAEATGKQTNGAAEANGEAGPIPALPNPSISTPDEATVRHSFDGPTPAGKAAALDARRALRPVPTDLSSSDDPTGPTTTEASA